MTVAAKEAAVLREVLKAHASNYDPLDGVIVDTRCPSCLKNWAYLTISPQASNLIMR
jgi:hypothetical protein